MDALVWAPQQMTRVDGSLLSVRRVTGREIVALPAAIIDIGPQAEWLQIELVGQGGPVWVARELTKVAGGSLSSILQIALEEDASRSRR